VKYLCLLLVFFTLPVPATAQQRRSEDRRTGDRGSSERSTADRRGNADRDDRDRGSRDRGDKGRDTDRGTPGRNSTKINPLVPSWEQKPAPWWENQATPWWERRQSPTSTTNTNRNAYDNQREYHGRRYNNGSGVVYVVPSYPYFQETVTTVETPPPPAPVITQRPPQPPPPAIGFLNLEVEPRELLQIYVDGVYIGTPADLGSELRLTTGVRRIELRARGYKTVSFDAEILEDRSITYRATLERDGAAPAPPTQPAIVRPPAASGPSTMYMIQGCYLGNIAPKAADLRAGCDIAKMITFRP
jgi:hypothetical protein